MAQMISGYVFVSDYKIRGVLSSAGTQITTSPVIVMTKINANLYKVVTHSGSIYYVDHIPSECLVNKKGEVDFRPATWVKD